MDIVNKFHTCSDLIWNEKKECYVRNEDKKIYINFFHIKYIEEMIDNSLEYSYVRLFFDPGDSIVCLKSEVFSCLGK